MAQKPVGLSTRPDPDEVEPAHSEIVLSLPAVSDSLQAMSSAFVLEASSSGLNQDASQYQVYLNRKLIPHSQIEVGSDRLTITSPLVEGKNEITFYSPDAAGAAMEFDFELWAGNSTVQGKVVDRQGNPVSGVQVTAALGEDSNVSAITTTNSSGTYTLRNFPGRMVIVSVVGPAGTASGIAGGPFPNVVLIPFSVPVRSSNNDFSSGASVWRNPDNASVESVPHIKNPGPASAPK